MNNNLSGASVYLSGAMQFSPDNGVSWRQEFINKSSHLNLTYFDPCNKPKEFEQETFKERDRINDLRAKGDFISLTKKMKLIRRFDLRCVDLADFLVVYIDPKIPTVGTIDEAIMGERQGKPVYIICNGGVSKLPDWLFAVADYKEVFSSVDECVAHLNMINSLPAEQFRQDKRWVLLRKYV